MSEIPKGTQFVGQADARNLRMAEVITPVDVKLSPEQQQVADVMKVSGEILEKKIIDARENAGQKLQGLHGQELVDAGKKQMVRGVIETLKSEAKGLLAGGVLGGLIRGAHWGLADRSVDSAYVGGIMGGVQGAGVGAIIGYEAAGLTYNRRLVKTKEMPPTRWQDWVLSHAANYGITFLIPKIPNLQVAFASAIIIPQVVNPITVGGLRNVMTGIWQMRKG